MEKFFGKKGVSAKDFETWFIVERLSMLNYVILKYLVWECVNGIFIILLTNAISNIDFKTYWLLLYALGMLIWRQGTQLNGKTEEWVRFLVRKRLKLNNVSALNPCSVCHK